MVPCQAICLFTFAQMKLLYLFEHLETRVVVAPFETRSQLRATCAYEARKTLDLINLGIYLVRM